VNFYVYARAEIAAWTHLYVLAFDIAADKYRLDGSLIQINALSGTFRL
jgi:hypothetical protein